MRSGALKVAVFRAGDDAAATGAALAERGFGAVLAPVTQIVGLAATQPTGPFDFALATSAKAFVSPVGLAGLPLYVVGEKTAQAARHAGFASAEPAEDVADLIARLPPGRALYLAGRDRKPDLERALRGRIAVVETYAAEARAGWAEDEARAVAAANAALHYSPRAASLALAFAASAGVARAFLRLPHVCLSREVAAPLAEAGAARMLWPRHPAENPLFDTLESALAERI